MERFARFFCDPIKVIKTVAVLAVSIVVVVYAYLQAMGGFNDEIETTVSYLVNLNDSIDADAYIFRDETVISKTSDGTVVTLVSEGDRVSKGQMIANVYSDSDDTSLQDDVNRVQRRLDILNDSALDSEFVISDLTELDDDIGEIFADIYSDAADGRLSEVIDNSSELLVKLNKRDLIVDSDFDYSGEQAALEQEKQELESRIRAISSPVYASSSGYFYGDVDGYEKQFDIKLVEGLTLENFDELASSKPDEGILMSGGVKLVNDFVWYTVCRIDYDDLAGVKEGYAYVLSFPENADYEIKMTLDRIVKETNSADALVIFRANVLPDDFVYKRYQKAEIVLGGISGLSVPKKALRIIDGVEGVYVLVGDVVRFRRIERIAEKDDYYIVKQKTTAELFEENENIENPVRYLSLYDNIVISGKNLFDGKIVG